MYSCFYCLSTSSYYSGVKIFNVTGSMSADSIPSGTALITYSTLITAIPAVQTNPYFKEHIGSYSYTTPSSIKYVETTWGGSGSGHHEYLVSLWWPGWRYYCGTSNNGSNYSVYTMTLRNSTTSMINNTTSLTNIPANYAKDMLFSLSSDKKTITITLNAMENNFFYDVLLVY